MTNAIRLYAAALIVGTAHIVTAPALAAAPTYELVVDMDGQRYIADSGLSKEDCMESMRGIATMEMDDGRLIRVPATADVYCIMER